MFGTPTVTHTQTYMYLEDCIHVHTQDPQAHMLSSKCLHMHEVHTSMFVYSYIPICTFHTFAHSLKFTYLSLHTHNSHLHSYVHMLTYSPMFAHTLTMITYTHPCIFAHLYRTAYTLIHCCTHTCTLAYSPILKHTNYAKVSHSPNMACSICTTTCTTVL